MVQCFIKNYRKYLKNVAISKVWFQNGRSKIALKFHQFLKSLGRPQSITIIRLMMTALIHFSRDFFYLIGNFFFLLKINSPKLLCQKNVDLYTFKKRFSSISTFYFNVIWQMALMILIEYVGHKWAMYDMVKTELKNRAKIYIIYNDFFHDCKYILYYYICSVENGTRNTSQSFPPNFEVCISYGYLGWWFLSVIKLMALSRQMVGLVQKSAFLVMNLLNTQYLNSG